MIPPFTRLVSRKALFSLAGLAILLVPLGFYVYANHYLESRRVEFESSLSRDLRVPAQIEKLRYRLFSGLWIEGLSLDTIQDNSLPSPVHVQRIRVRPWISFYRPLSIKIGWEITLYRPTFSLRGSLQDIFQLGRFLAQSPQREKNWGPFKFTFQLRSIRMRDGRITLVEHSPMARWKQTFDHVRASLDRRWFGGETLSIEGRIENRPESAFQIRGRMRGSAGEDIDSDLRIECQRFASSYLPPHLGTSFQLPGDEITANVRLKMYKGKMFFSQGKLSFPGRVGENLIQNYLKKSSPEFRYRVQGNVTGPTCRLSNLWLSVMGAEMRGSGLVRLDKGKPSYRIALTSAAIPFKRIQDLGPRLRPESGQIWLALVLTGSLSRVSPYLVVTLDDCSFADADGQVWLSKLSGRLRLMRGRLVLNELWAFANNLPFRVNGSVCRSEHPRVKLDFSTYPGQVPSLRFKNRLNACARVDASFDGAKWKGSLEASRSVLRRGKWREEFWSAAADGLTIERRATRPDRFLKGTAVRFRTLFLRHEASPDAPSRVFLQYPAFFIYGDFPQINCDLDSVVAGGSLTLKSYIDARRISAPSWKIKASVSGAEAGTLARMFGREWPVRGALSGDGEWSQDAAHRQSQARLRLQNGSVGPVPALEKLAEQTGIEPLKKIDFEEFTGLLSWDGRDLNIENAKLNGPQAQMAGNLKVRDGRMVGYLSARFPESAVAQSSSLKWLMHFVGGKDWVDFDFRIAGSFMSPRVQWLAGEFKRKIETHLAPWMRNRLTHEIEKQLLKQTE